MPMPAIPADLYALLGGVGAILIVASVAGYVLQQRHGNTDVIVNLNARIVAWWIMVGCLAAAFAAGRAGVIGLFALLSLGAMREFVAVSGRDKADRWALIVSFVIALPVQYWLIWVDWYGLYAVFIPVYAFLALAIAAVLRGETDGFLDRIAGAHWALMICVYAVSHVPALLYLQIPGFEGRSVLLIAYLIFVVQFSDVMQYVWGKLLGRHKIAPRLSPSKTWEGFMGGIVTATLAGACLWWMTPFTFVQSGLMALVITIMGFFGGLVMSAIKRDRGAKDWGDIIAGHGGVMDRLDSVVFSAPVFFHLTRFFWSTV
jgi:phosphatidate cytidylyltransferase